MQGMGDGGYQGAPRRRPFYRRSYYSGPPMRRPFRRGPRPQYNQVYDPR